MEFTILEWVDWLNHRLLLGSRRNTPPAEAESSITLCWTNRLWPHNLNQNLMLRFALKDCSATPELNCPL